MEDHRFTVRLGLAALVATTAYGCAQSATRSTEFRRECVVARASSSARSESTLRTIPSFTPRRPSSTSRSASTASLFTRVRPASFARIKWEITEKVLNARLTYENDQERRRQGKPRDQQRRRSSPPSTSRATSTSSATTTRRPAKSSTSSAKTRAIGLGTSASTCASTGRPTRSSRPTRSTRWRAPRLDGRRARAAHLPRRRPQRSRRPGVRRPRRATSTSPTRSTSSRRTISGSSGVLLLCRHRRRRHVSLRRRATPSEVKLRLSFLRIAQRGEPATATTKSQEWDGARFNAHGAFTHDRLGYDRHYGIIDSKWHHLHPALQHLGKEPPAVTCARDRERSACDVADARRHRRPVRRGGRGLALRRVRRVLHDPLRAAANAPECVALQFEWR